LTDGLDTHRLLPDQQVLGALYAKWDKLKDATGRHSRLLYKRRFLRVDEVLQGGDLTHANLTYRQALWDYQHYPVSEDINFLCHVASMVIANEYDAFENLFDKAGDSSIGTLQPAKIADIGVLEQLLPEHAIREQKRTRWGQLIAECFKTQTVDLDEMRLLKMNRVMSLLQKMKLFGAYYWMGKQLMTVPKEKVSVDKAPDTMCKLNTRNPEAEYWVCLDVFGIRFVSVDSSTGLQRGFLFNEEAVERVLFWGAKQNVLQLVVQTVNPSMPNAGRAPHTIALVSPAAIDIAYAIHIICRDCLSWGSR